MSAKPSKSVDTDEIVGHFINGSDIADDNRPLPVMNPATGEMSKQVAMASKKTVEEATLPLNLPSRRGVILRRQSGQKSCFDSSTCSRNTQMRLWRP